MDHCAPSWFAVPVMLFVKASKIKFKIELDFPSFRCRVTRLPGYEKCLAAPHQEAVHQHQPPLCQGQRFDLHRQAAPELGQVAGHG